jgi:hypothetical protein
LKSLNFIIDLHIYQFDVMVSIGETDDELDKKLKKYGIEDEDKLLCMFESRGVGRTVSFKGGQTLIRCKNYPRTSEDFGTLAHEIFHAVHYIMERINFQVTLDNSEPFAHLIGYLTREIYARIKKK